MKCNKCKEEFEEKDLELSHDVPKYMGGIDLNGRHWLCKDCHKEYEWEVIKVCFMNFVKHLPEFEKSKFRFLAKQVSKYFFKED